MPRNVVSVLRSMCTVAVTFNPKQDGTLNENITFAVNSLNPLAETAWPPVQAAQSAVTLSQRLRELSLQPSPYLTMPLTHRKAFS